MCTTRACVCASNLYVLYFICIIFLIFIILFSLFLFFFFFFNDTATTEIYTSFPTRRSSDLFFVLPAGAADRVKVGFVSTLSGPNAAIGGDIRDGFNLALKLGGGKLGGLPAEVLIGDDQIGRAHV